jgi:hypothetical protein
MFSALFRNRGKHINFSNATDDDDNRICFLTKKKQKFSCAEWVSWLIGIGSFLESNTYIYVLMMFTDVNEPAWRVAKS